VLYDCLDQAFLGERLGEIAIGAGEPAACAVEHAVLAGQHDHRRRFEQRVLLDERAGLVTVEPRHHDVDEDDLRLVVADLCQRVEAVLGEDDFVACLAQEQLGASTNGVAVVDDEHLDRTCCRDRHAGNSPLYELQFRTLWVLGKETPFLFLSRVTQPASALSRLRENVSTLALS
jgi:hypothetical protein